MREIDVIGVGSDEMEQLNSIDGGARARIEVVTAEMGKKREGEEKVGLGKERKERKDLKRLASGTVHRQRERERERDGWEPPGDVIQKWIPREVNCSVPPPLEPGARQAWQVTNPVKVHQTSSEGTIKPSSGRPPGP